MRVKVRSSFLFAPAVPYSLSTEELPSLSQILPRHRLRMAGNMVEETSASSSGSINATTYDGKTLHLKRRLKRKPETNTVSFSL